MDEKGERGIENDSLMGDGIQNQGEISQGPSLKM